MRLFHSSTPSFYHATHTISLHTKSSTIPLHELVAPLVPPYYGNPLLFNGHLQTAWTVAKFRDPFPIHYVRKHMISPRDGGHFAVDFVTDGFPDADSPDDLPPRTRHMSEDESAKLGSDDDRPMLIAMHGLSGGSHEMYLRAVLSSLLTPGSDWTACVVNARGCAMSKITSKQLFNARFTQDIRETVKYLTNVFPNRPLYAIGFSLGANILANYLGEEGDNCVFHAAVMASNPWNLELSNKALHRTWIGSEVYSRVMGGNLRRLFEDNLEVITQDTRVDVGQVRRGTYIYEFDRDLTAKVFGYPTVGAYYRDASSVDNLLKIRVPVLIVHAKDDPIAPNEAVPYDEARANPYVFMAVTEWGGHLGWFETGGGRWFTKPVSAFLKAFASEVVGVLPMDTNVGHTGSSMPNGVDGVTDN